MAHYQKFKRGAVGLMLEHYDRSKPSDKLIYNPTLTKGNYNLCEGEGSQLERLRSVIGNKADKVTGWAKCQNRQDVNVMCTWIVSLPKDFPADKQEQFFKESYDFLKSRFGVEDGRNIISAYVHLDESNPHMHFCFVPVVKDKKKDRWKVSAKECVTLTELKGFHKALEEHLEGKLGISVGVRNGATVEGNKSVAELRQMTATGQVQAIKEQLAANERKEQELSKKEQDLADGVSALSVKKNELEQATANKEKQIAELDKEIASRVLVAHPQGYIVVNEQVEQVKAYLKGLQENKGWLGGADGTFTISKQAKMFIEKVIDGLEFNTREIARLQKSIAKAEERGDLLAKENKSLSSSLQAFENLKALVGADVWSQVQSIARQKQEQARQLRQKSKELNSVRKNTPYKGR